MPLLLLSLPMHSKKSTTQLLRSARNSNYPQALWMYYMERRKQSLTDFKIEFFFIFLLLIAKNNEYCFVTWTGFSGPSTCTRSIWNDNKNMTHSNLTKIINTKLTWTFSYRFTDRRNWMLWIFIKALFFLCFFLLFLH